VNASPSTPIGASHNTQPMITSIASPSASKNSAMAACLRASTRVMAIANRVVKKTSGRIAPSAAALTILAGTADLTRSPSVGTDAAVAPWSTPARPARSASAATWGNGNTDNNPCITTAPKIADDDRITANHSIDRPAIPPSRAAALPPTMPVTSSATISGTTVIFNASSHRPPTVAAICTAGSRHAPLDSAPASRPMSSAPSTRHVGPMGNPRGLAAIGAPA